MRLDRLVDFGKRVAGRMSRPGHIHLGFEDRDIGLHTARGGDDLREPHGRRTVVTLRYQVGGEFVGPRHGGGQTNGREVRRKRPQAHKIQRQKIAALAGAQGVKFIEDHIFQISEERARAVVGQHQGDLLRRGQQNIGRQHALPRAAGLRRIAGPGFELDRQTHLGDGRREIARDIGRQCLERRDIERVDAARRTVDKRPAREIDKARKKSCQGFAAAGRGDQKRVAAVPGPFQQLELVGAWMPAPRREPVRECLGQMRRLSALIVPGCRFPRSRAQLNWSPSGCAAVRA